ncbi:MAG: hypothetical protein FD145_594 [Candidatus Saganbacteria bacterium]|uniref:Uncharacterized protein n=1 Tax=Candidatus Saganbacteria bacterium TaxID=2575572 RepID=A0A833L1N5_UNCSA|nr:MAG: hypothetical protein FD145_594 [Candidatus Saganbacteria bacterium]
MQAYKLGMGQIISRIGNIAFSKNPTVLRVRVAGKWDELTELSFDDLHKTLGTARQVNQDLIMAVGVEHLPQQILEPIKTLGFENEFRQFCRCLAFCSSISISATQQPLIGFVFDNQFRDSLFTLQQGEIDLLSKPNFIPEIERTLFLNAFDSDGKLLSAIDQVVSILNLVGYLRSYSLGQEHGIELEYYPRRYLATLYQSKIIRQFIENNKNALAQELQNRWLPHISNELYSLASLYSEQEQALYNRLIG